MARSGGITDRSSCPGGGHALGHDRLGMRRAYSRSGVYARVRRAASGDTGG